MIMVSLLIRSEKGLRHLSNQCAKKLIGVSQIQTQVNAESASEVKVTNINFEEINAIQLTDAHELQKILHDTTRYVTVHLNNEFFISSVSAFGSLS